MKVLIVLSVLIIGTFGQLEPISIPIDTLPIPNIDDIAVIKERCDKQGGEGAYEKVKEAKTEFESCVKGMFNLTQIKLDLEEKAKTGSMEEVFGKECNKRPDLKNCVTKLTDAIKPCLQETERDALNRTLDLLEQLGDFACYKDGDRMAMFVAEGGVECIRDHTDGIQKCVETTFNIDSSSVNTNTLPSFIIDKQKCDDFSTLQNCVVEELEKCEESTPANVVDALFRFVKRSTCQDKQRKRSIFKRSALTDIFNGDDARQQMLDSLKDSCKKYGTPNSFSNMETSYDEATVCIRNIRRNILISNNISEMKEKLGNCMSTLIKNMEECLPENAKFIPEFYMKIVYAMVDFIIDNRQRMQTSGFAMELMNCMQNIKNNEANLGKLQECGMKLNKLNETTITKEELCDNISVVSDCISDEISHICVRDIAIQNFLNDFLKALHEPCDEE